MQQYYDREQAKKGSYLPAVEFEGQKEERKIELEIPFSKGIVHEDWRIYPLIPPIVSSCNQG